MISIKKVISYILAIILVVFISAIFLLVALNITLLSKSNVKKQIANIDYNTQIYNIILDAANNYLMQSGFDEDILKNVIDKEIVNKDIENIIDAMYDGTELNISTDEMKANLEQNISNYISENNYEVNETERHNINIFEDKIIDMYNKNITYSKSTIEEIAKYIKLLKKAVIIAIIVLVILTIVLAIIIYKLNKPTLGISIMTTGIIFIITHFYSTLNVAINNILMFNKAFSNFLIVLANQLMRNIFIYGIVLTIIGLALMIIAEMKVAKKYVNGENKDKEVKD